VVAVAGIAFTLAGCSAASGSSGGTSGDTVLTWSVWAGSEAETAAWQHVADLVHKKDPSITLKLQTAAWTDYWTKLPTQLAGSNAPCIVGLQMARVQQFANYFKTLDKSALASANVSTGDFDQSILKALESKGQLKALPYDLGPYMIYYNKDAFKAAGLSDPQNGWTIDEFEKDAKALTTGGKYGFAVNNQIDALNEWGPTIGGDQAATAGGKLNVTSAGQLATMKWYAGLVTQEKVAAPLATDSSDGAQFLGGNAAMYVSGPWDMINAKAQAKFDVGVVTVPAGEHGVTTSIGGSGFGVTSSCSNVPAAEKALGIITGPDALAYLGEQGRAFPARTAQQSTWYKSAVAGAQSTLDAALKDGVPYLSTPTWTQAGLAYSQGAISAINGETSPKDFLQSVADSQ
jgi:multiple sugar transport system substrate-binding protein